MGSLQHERFLGRLSASSDAVLAVASWLHRSGKSLEIPPTRFAPTAADAPKFFDNGDLVVVDRKIIQVKGISRDFTCREDWPFAEFFISNRAAVERFAEQEVIYITVSRNRQYAGIVEGKPPRSRWYLSEKRAGNTGNVESYYACTLDEVVFRRIAETQGSSAP